MKKTIITSIGLLLLTTCICFVAVAYAQKPSPSQDSRKWEYASLVLLPSTEAAFWCSPTDAYVEASSVIGLAIKLGCDKPFFPPEYPILNHYGNKGWELVQIVGPKNSMGNAYICWFKRPKL